METVYRARQISKNVFWVGAIDWNIRDFHGYTTKRGSTYNAYLICADRITLIDTVKAPFLGEMLSRIASVIDPSEIQYIVSNHSEMDHTGGLPEALQVIKPEKLFASTMGKKALYEHFRLGNEVEEVKEGEFVDLGSATLSFMETRMLHWPDSMCTYLSGDEVLFSQDAFGMHLATSARFDDEIDISVLEYEAATYFANILLPYSNLIEKVVGRVLASGWKISLVAPDHGPVWRANVHWILGKYGKWARQEPAQKAVVVYDTMWNSTDKMARAIGEGLSSQGIDVKFMQMGAVHRSDVAYELLESGAFIVGAPTLNNNMFPSMADVLCYIKGLKPKNLFGAAFGSYGWSGESVPQMEAILDEMKVERVGESVKARYVPNEETLKECHRLGVSVGQELLKRCSS